MFVIDHETLNACLNHGNTVSVDFWISKQDVKFDITPGTDKIYLAIRDKFNAIVFDGVYDVEEVDQPSSTRYKWTFTINHGQSETIPPGQYTWDFTYFQNATIDPESGKPVDGTFVDTPFCQNPRSQFVVMAIDSDARDHEPEIIPDEDQEPEPEAEPKDNGPNTYLSGEELGP